MTKLSDCAFPWGEAASGLSKREYFAAMALQGIISTADDSKITTINPGKVARSALQLADALIKELNKPKDL